MGHRCSKLWQKRVIKSAANRRYPGKREMTGSEHRVETQKVNTEKQMEKSTITGRV